MLHNNTSHLNHCIKYHFSTYQPKPCVLTWLLRIRGNDITFTTAYFSRSGCFPFKKGRKIHFNGILLTYWNCLRNTYYNAALVTSGIGIWRSFIIVFASICGYHCCKKNSSSISLFLICFVFPLQLIRICLMKIWKKILSTILIDRAMNYNNCSLIPLYVFRK